MSITKLQEATFPSNPYIFTTMKPRRKSNEDSFIDEDVIDVSSKSTGSSGFLNNDETENENEASGLSSASNASDAAKELRDTVIRDEERAVRKVRALVGACVAACGIAVTVAVYFLGKARSDKVMFEQDVSANSPAICRTNIQYHMFPPYPFYFFRLPN